MNRKILLFIFILIVSACASPQVTEEIDCCLAVDFTAPVPTETQTPIQTFTQTPYPTFVYDATQKAFQTKVAEFPRLCSNEVPYFSEKRKNVSPDGFWFGEVCWAYDTEFNDLVLNFSNKETGKVWNLPYHDYIDVSYADGGMLIIHWSNDSRYVYFKTDIGGSVGECYYEGYDTGRGVFRLDLQTGQVNEILPLTNGYAFYNFSFSPIDKWMVYSINIISVNPFLRNAQLKILNITTGKSIDVSHVKELNESGGFIWSSDGKEFIYSTLLYKDSYERDSYSLRLVNAETGAEKIILEAQMACFLVVEWKDNILKIEKNYNESIIEFDLNTNTIFSETPINP